MSVEGIPNLNEPILFGPKSLNISHRWWKWLQKRMASPAWQAPVLGTNITYYGAPYTPPGYCIDGLGRVWIRGLVKGTGLILGATIFTLPAGFMPPFVYQFGMFGYTGSAAGIYQVSVGVSGAVILENGPIVGASAAPTSFLYLDGISFLTY